DFWEAWGAVASYGRDFLRAFGDNAGSGAGSDAGGAEKRNDCFLRPELPGIALEAAGREEAGAGGEPEDCATCGRDAGERGRFFGRAGLRSARNGRAHVSVDRKSVV